ncbi:hypothetical protein QE152_g31472 [Popillia japonica]|uniref:Uncharacterized protein n=1 Tax=Popillia japonica TaxID=7064 RepID=A0AAW1J1W0_POPJA
MGLDFLTITETKRKGEGGSKTTKGHTLIHSGAKTEKRAAAGVGCLINKRHERREEQKRPIIVVYGFNEDDKAENKEKFWEELTIAVAENKEKFWEELTIAVEEAKGRLYITG